MKLVRFVGRNKKSNIRIPKSGGSFETFEKWFCDEFHIKPTELSAKAL